MTISAPNARINQALLAFLIGNFFTNLPFDHHWFNYLLDEPSRLRSVVVASVRVAAADHYRLIAKTAPTWFLFVPWIIFGLLALSMVSSAVRDSAFRASHIVSSGLLGGAIYSTLVLIRPAAQSLAKTSAPNAEAIALRQFALGHLMNLILLTLALFVQFGVSAAGDDDEEEEVKPKKH